MARETDAVLPTPSRPRADALPMHSVTFGPWWCEVVFLAACVVVGLLIRWALA